MRLYLRDCVDCISGSMLFRSFLSLCVMAVRMRAKE